ncbi:MAG: CobD/CbiB family cobalamin biosynthesis protein [Actinomycetes bacterium]
MSGRPGARLGTLAVAVALDAALGEPPARVHPVVGMGRLLGALERRLPGPDAPGARTAGALALAAGAGVVGAAALACARLPWPLQGVALWTLGSGRMLLDEVAAVADALDTDGVEAGRARLAWLVSRDTSALDGAGVASAALETLAENLADAAVGTLVWWTLGGLPAAAVHRFVDTADSTWGYRTPAWERRGWAAARTDDLLAAVPARLTAWLLALDPRGASSPGDPRRRRAARRTPSPNGGWPMGTLALALDVRLEKPGTHVLHDDGRAPTTDDVRRGLAHARRALALAVAATAGVALLRDRATARVVAA